MLAMVHKSPFLEQAGAGEGTTDGEGCPPYPAGESLPAQTGQNAAGLSERGIFLNLRKMG
jgi:hypothetical protein